MTPCHATTIKVLRSSRSGSTVTTSTGTSTTSPVLVSQTISYAGGDAAAGPMIRRGSNSVSVVSKATKTILPGPLGNVSVSAATPVLAANSTPSPAASPINRPPSSMPATSGESGSSGTRVVLAAAGSSAGYTTSQVTSASTNAALSRMAASSQLRAVSLEYSHSDLTAATRNWSPSRRLGSGKHGSVFKGELKDGSEVAVKAIDLAAVIGSGDAPEDAGFDEEVIMLSKFRHPNLVTLLGWGSHKSYRYLIYELLAGGDLFRRLHRSRSSNPRPFLWHERLSVCLNAATGLSHMHNSTPKAFHRDIKSANILLDRHGTAKMADFGLSCSSGYAGADHVDVRYASGTPGYRCPLYERSGRVTEASEAYSFCMVILEVLLGLDPSAADSKVPGGLIFPIADAVSPGQSGAEDRCLKALDKVAGWPIELAKELISLAIRGTNAQDEKKRPSFVEIVRGLRSLSERYPQGYVDAAAKPLEPTPATSSTSKVEAPPSLAKAKAPPFMSYQPQRASLPASNVVQRSYVPPRINDTQEPEEEDQPRQILSPTHDVASRGWSVNGATTRSTSLSRPLLASEVAFTPKASTAATAAATPTATEEVEAPYFLELTLATGSGIEELPHDQRRFPLKITQSADGVNVSAVGRGQQPELFESWLPDVRIRTCISRLAFEVTWRRTPAAPGAASSETGPWITAKGSGPVSVDGRVLQSKVACVLRVGADIGLLYGKQLLVRFRFQEVPTKAAVIRRYTGGLPAPSSSPVIVATMGESQVVAQSPSSSSSFRALPQSMPRSQGAVTPGTPRITESIRKMRTGSLGGAPIAAEVSSTLAVETPQQHSRSLSFQPASRPAPQRWRLAVIRAEGLPEERLSQLPSVTAHLVMPEIGSELLLGRDHQPRLLTAWLPDPVIRLCVARTHLRARSTEEGLLVANLSNALLYVDDQPLMKDEEKLMLPGQVLSFMRSERIGGRPGDTTPFLALRLAPPGSDASLFVQAQQVQQTSQPVEAITPASVDRVASAPRTSASGLANAAAVAVLLQDLPPPVVTLSLSGDALLQVPVFNRRVGPVSLAGKPLLVGSRHQPELFGDGMMKAYSNIVDRDHFCIASEGGAFWLLCLTSKGLWRVREGEEPLRLILDDLAPLQANDIIVPRLSAVAAADEVPLEQCRRVLQWNFLVLSDASR